MTNRSKIVTGGSNNCGPHEKCRQLVIKQDRTRGRGYALLRCTLELQIVPWPNNLPNISMPSLSYIGLKKPSTNWINHHVIKNVTATGNRTTLQYNFIRKGQKENSEHNVERVNFLKPNSLPSSHELLGNPTLKNSIASLIKQMKRCYLT